MIDYKKIPKKIMDYYNNYPYPRIMHGCPHQSALMDLHNLLRTKVKIRRSNRKKLVRKEILDPYQYYVFTKLATGTTYKELCNELKGILTPQEIMLLNDQAYRSMQRAGMSTADILDAAGLGLSRIVMKIREGFEGNDESADKWRARSDAIKASIELIKTLDRIENKEEVDKKKKKSGLSAHITQQEDIIEGIEYVEEHDVVKEELSVLNSMLNEGDNNGE